MKRVVLLPLLLLAHCASSSPTVVEAPAPACRGSQPVVERGIGGTGSPVPQVADRGIGGTGIIGVITGFGSVCVAGVEVALPASAATQIDAAPARPEDLRVGQVVALEAAGPAEALRARQVAVRHAVIGPVETAGPGVLIVAGQHVTLPKEILLPIKLGIGQWVAVSGLRSGDGAIAATRIDQAPPGRILVRGVLRRDEAGWRIDTLALRLPPGTDIQDGTPVVVRGRMARTVLVVDSIEPDVAAESPSTFFGPAISTFVVESDVSVLQDGFMVARDFVSGAAVGAAGSSGFAIAKFARGPMGLAATGVLTPVGSPLLPPNSSSAVPGGSLPGGLSIPGGLAVPNPNQPGAIPFGVPGSFALPPLGGGPGPGMGLGMMPPPGAFRR